MDGIDFNDFKVVKDISLSEEPTRINADASSEKLEKKL